MGGFAVENEDLEFCCDDLTSKLTSIYNRLEDTNLGINSIVTLTEDFKEENHNDIYDLQSECENTTLAVIANKDKLSALISKATSIDSFLSQIKDYTKDTKAELKIVNIKLTELIALNKFIKYNNFFTYITLGNGKEEVSTITYKEGTAVIMITTFSYSASGKVISKINTFPAVI